MAVGTRSEIRSFFGPPQCHISVLLASISLLCPPSLRFGSTILLTPCPPCLFLHPCLLSLPFSIYLTPSSFSVPSLLPFCHPEHSPFLTCLPFSLDKYTFSFPVSLSLLFFCIYFTLFICHCSCLHLSSLLLHPSFFSLTFHLSITLSTFFFLSFVSFILSFGTEENGCRLFSSLWPMSRESAVPCAAFNRRSSGHVCCNRCLSVAVVVDAAYATLMGFLVLALTSI